MLEIWTIDFIAVMMMIRHTHQIWTYLGSRGNMEALARTATGAQLIMYPSSTLIRFRDLQLKQQELIYHVNQHSLLQQFVPHTR